MDVAELSDADLRAKLTEYGVNPGPIGATTRLFYEKKLGKLIDSGGVPEPQEEDEEDEEEEEDEEVQINYRTAPRTYAAPPVSSKPYATPPASPKKQRPPVSPKPYSSSPVLQRKEPISQDYTPITKARRATVDTPTRKQDERLVSSSTQRSTSKSAPKSGGIAMWMKLLFIIIVALLIYLVVINMNQSAQDKIPISHDEV